MARTSPFLPSSRAQAQVLYKAFPQLIGTLPSIFDDKLVRSPSSFTPEPDYPTTRVSVMDDDLLPATFYPSSLVSFAFEDDAKLLASKSYCLESGLELHAVAAFVASQFNQLLTCTADEDYKSLAQQALIAMAPRLASLFFFYVIQFLIFFFFQTYLNRIWLGSRNCPAFVYHLLGGYTEILLDSQLPMALQVKWMEHWALSSTSMAGLKVCTNLFGRSRLCNKFFSLVGPEVRSSRPRGFPYSRAFLPRLARRCDYRHAGS
jgi:hypothetical protein